jgi:hypothetical protein
MYGLMTAECASSAIVITSGTFTQDAKMFAENKPSDLVAANQVTDLIRSGAKNNLFRSQLTATHNRKKNMCGKCGAELVLRIARKGSRCGANSGAAPLFKMYLHSRIHGLKLQFHRYLRNSDLVAHLVALPLSAFSRHWALPVLRAHGSLGEIAERNGDP